MNIVHHMAKYQSQSRLCCLILFMSSCSQYLTSEDAHVLCILGSGAQARSHAEALKHVRSFSEVL